MSPLLFDSASIPSEQIEVDGSNPKLATYKVNTTVRVWTCWLCLVPLGGGGGRRHRVSVRSTARCRYGDVYR